MFYQYCIWWREKLQANIKVRRKTKKNPNFQISCDNFSTNILDVILSGKQDLMCIGFYSIYALTENLRVIRWN